MVGGDFKLKVALALQSAEGEGVAVDSAEGIGVGGRAGAEVLGVRDHLSLCVGALDG